LAPIRERRRHAAPLPAEHRMTDAVDAMPHAAKLPGSEPMLNRRPTEPHPYELPMSRDPVLSLGECCDLPITWAL
ncbi:MAG: hypothetical protein ACJ766_09940, partial [Thermoleophilaceae bacterium]